MVVTTSRTDLPRVAGRAVQPGAVQTGRAELAPGNEFSTRAAAEAYIGKVCFKQGPPMLIGAELEWLTAQGEPSASAPRPQLTVLADALGSYAPQSISPDSPADPLPGGSRVTLEPGGQIELSSAPFGTAAELCERLLADTGRLRELLDTRDIHIISASADPVRSPQRLLQLPRYRAMESSFAGIGPFGALMMCNTAAAQVSVDAGVDAADIAARWTALYAIGPALLAAFACSPDLSGAPPAPGPPSACVPGSDWTICAPGHPCTTGPTRSPVTPAGRSMCHCCAYDPKARGWWTGRLRPAPPSRTGCAAPSTKRSAAGPLATISTIT